MLRRIFTILAILASIGVVVVVQTQVRPLIQGIMDEREKNAKDRDSNKARYTKAETALKNTSNELVTTTSNLRNTTSELESTKGNLAKANTELDTTKQSLQKAKDGEKEAKQSLEAWTILGIKPEGVKTLQDQAVKDKETIGAMDTENKVLNGKVRKLETELAKYLDPENYVVPLPKGLAGNVLVVDPKWEFVLLDIGEKQGVLKDGIMLVHREGKLVGKVRIKTVMPERSIANIMPGWKVTDIQEKDKVLF